MAVWSTVVAILNVVTFLVVVGCRQNLGPFLLLYSVLVLYQLYDCFMFYNEFLYVSY